MTLRNQITISGICVSDVLLSSLQSDQPDTVDGGGAYLFLPNPRSLEPHSSAVQNESLSAVAEPYRRRGDP